MTKNESRRLKKAIELIELLLAEIKTSKDLTVVFRRRDSFHHIFYNENRLDELFLSIFPINDLEYISNVLSIIKMANATMGDDELSGYGGSTIKKPQLIAALEKISFHLNSLLLRMALISFTLGKVTCKTIRTETLSKLLWKKPLTM